MLVNGKTSADSDVTTANYGMFTNNNSDLNGSMDMTDVVDYEQAYELIDSVSLMEKAEQARAIPALFEFIETHFDKDLGSPGPFVHFLEEQDCEQELLESLRRKPTDLTVHMVNRILNSLSGIEHTRWLKELEIVIIHPKAD